MASTENNISLKDHFEAILAEKEKALQAALVANEKRLDLLNELRSGVATKDQVDALEKIVEDLKLSRATGQGKTVGYTQFVGWLVAAAAIGASLMKIFNG